MAVDAKGRDAALESALRKLVNENPIGVAAVIHQWDTDAEALVQSEPSLPTQQIYYEGADDSGIEDYATTVTLLNGPHRIDMSSRQARRLAIYVPSASGDDIHCLVDAPTTTYADTVLDAADRNAGANTAPDVYLCRSGAVTYIPADGYFTADLQFLDFAWADYSGTGGPAFINITVNP